MERVALTTTSSGIRSLHNTRTESWTIEHHNHVKCDDFPYFKSHSVVHQVTRLVLNDFKILQHEDASTTGVSSVRQFVFSGAKTPKHQVQAALKELGNISRTIERFFWYPQLVQLSRNVFTVRLR
jgi:hypothetical protein